MFLLLGLLLLLVVPSPWNVVAAVASAAVGVVEVAYWQRRMRLQKVAVGVETVVGATGVVTEPCAPLGMVRVRGELWRARSTPVADRGAVVRVVAVGVDGLTLEVEPVEQDAGAGGVSPG